VFQEKSWNDLPLESTAAAAAAAAASELSLSATDESTLPDLEQVLFFFSCCINMSGWQFGLVVTLWPRST